jgi:hypothetical protein
LSSTGGRAYDERVKSTLYKGLISTLLIASLAACASTPSGHSASTSVAQAKGVPPGCVPSTGTRLARTSGDCAGTGSVWTKEELRRTGALDPGQALSLLDPTVTSRH